MGWCVHVVMMHSFSIDVFHYDKEFLENEERYKAIKEGM